MLLSMLIGFRVGNRSPYAGVKKQFTNPVYQRKHYSSLGAVPKDHSVCHNNCSRLSKMEDGKFQYYLKSAASPS